MQRKIKDVFEEFCGELLIDSVFAKKIIAYERYFVSKNDDHLKFFGGHLTGVQVVRFTPDDRAIWFEEILQCDDIALREELIKLPGVNKDFIVSSDAMNISCAWLVYALLQSSKIPDKLKHQAVISVLLVLQYKFLTSVLYHYFSYPADPAIAEATYAALSRKFALKQYGNWGSLLNARAESMVDHSGLHYKTLTRLDDDLRIQYFLNDTQTRIRDMLKNIMSIFKMIYNQGTRISSVSSVMEHDGKEVLRDQSQSLISYTRYLNSIIANKHDFVREELTTIIEKLIHTMPPNLFRKTLDWMSEHSQDAKSTAVEELIKETLVHCFDYLSHNRVVERNSHDLPGLLVRLKGVYTSARSTDPILFALREKTEAIVKQATHTTNAATLSPVRTGVLLYIVIRALTKSYYINAVYTV